LVGVAGRSRIRRPFRGHGAAITIRDFACSPRRDRCGHARGGGSLLVGPSARGFEEQAVMRRIDRNEEFGKDAIAQQSSFIRNIGAPCNEVSTVPSAKGPSVTLARVTSRSSVMNPSETSCGGGEPRCAARPSEEGRCSRCRAGPARLRSVAGDANAIDAVVQTDREQGGFPSSPGASRRSRRCFPA